jgi:hypothetical protein
MELAGYIIILLQHIIIGAVGTIGNIFVLLVYMKRLKDNEISTLFILYLAITDLTCCLILVPINCYVELLDLIPYDFLCKFHTFLSISNITYSCFLMTLVAIERYFSIIWPLHKIINKLRTKILTSILLLMCLIIALMGSLGVGIDHKATYVILNDVNMTTFNASNFIRPYGNHTDNVSDVWMRTYDCFHNDHIIKRDALAYIRLVQNSLPVICFFIIFFLYATIYISVSKRRKLKKDRDTYYKQILNRSRQFGASINTARNNREKDNRVRQSFLDIPNNASRNTSYASLNPLPQLEMEVFHFTAPLNEDAKLIKQSTLDCPIVDDNNNSNRILTTALSIDIIVNKASNLLQIDDLYNNNNNTDICSLTPVHTTCGDSRPPQQQQFMNGNTYDDRTAVHSSNLMANLKTAFMLFIVTVIMAIVFTPALLISFNIIPYNPFYWNLYFINNACNPIVYSFLNANFRNSLKNYLCSSIINRAKLRN